MEAILKFDLPEDANDHLLAIHGSDFALVCWNMDQRLRGWLKHGNQFKDVDDALEKTREALHDILDQHNVNLDMIE